MTASLIAQMSPMRMIVLRRTSALASTCSGEVLKINCSSKDSFSSVTGEIASDLYGLSGCDILNLTFCSLDFHQLLIKIS